MTIEEFIHASGHATSTQELFEAYKKKMATLGFDRIIFSLMTDHPSLQLPAGHGIMSNYPDEWMAFYTKQNYEMIDPVRRSVFIADSAFPWDSVLEGYPLTKKQIACLAGAREAGLHNGIGIPLRGPRGNGPATSAPKRARKASRSKPPAGAAPRPTARRCTPRPAVSI